MAACEEAFASRPTDKETAVCFYDLARSRDAQARAARARDALLRLAEEHADLPWIVYYTANLRWSETEVAEALYARTAEVFRRSGDEGGEVYSRINRSQLLGSLGRSVEAGEEIDRACEVATRSEDPELRSWGQLVMARRLFEEGRDLGRVLEILRAAERPKSEESYSMRRDRLLLLHSVAKQIGRLDEAREAAEEALDMALEEEDDYLEAVARYDIATVALARLVEVPSPEVREATARLALEALDAATRAEHRSIEIQSSWMLGFVAPEEDREVHLNRCLEMEGGTDLRSYCLSALALWQVAEDPEAAHRTASEAIALAEESENAWVPIFAWRAYMRILWASIPPDEALAESWSALDRIETLRDRQAGNDLAQARLFSVWSDDYAWLAGTLLERNRDGAPPSWTILEAFRVSERMRARALIDWLKRSATTADGENGSPEDPGFASLDEVRRGLGEREALLVFQLAPREDLNGAFAGGSWVLAVTRNDVTSHSLPGRSEVRNKVRLMEGAVTGRSDDGALVAAGGKGLYDDLLAEALDGLPEGIERLILVPDDALHRLPFAALRATEDGEPLGARYELVQVPSATLWLRWREAEVAPAEHRLLVLADPELPRTETAEDAPLQVAQTRGDGPETAPSLFRDAAEALGPLPGARREGKAALHALGGGELIVGGRATEETLRSMLLGDYRIVHFGAHAVTDEDHPERSAVLLAPSPGIGGGSPDAADDPRDGYLRSAEIAHLDLDGRLVVLASCRSAGGSTLRGEGVMSLARGFFQAGAHGVVASLWPLRDDESAAMFERFYDHLGRGESVAAALRSVRREAIAAGEPAAAWAGLVVLGDGSAVPLPGGRRLLDHPALPIVVPAVLAVAVVLLALFALRRRRRSHRRSAARTA